jgi:class 3 adenylate cyclase
MPIIYTDKYKHRARGFALFVDINGFTVMTATEKDDDMAQFVRDVLCGSVVQVEKCQGEVVSLGGDGLLAIIPEGKHIFPVCAGIAKDVNNLCEYLTGAQLHHGGWAFCPGGPSIKIGVEFGTFEISEIDLRFLGEQKLFVGPAINHASRIMTGVMGNECRIGPVAAAHEDLKDYPLGPIQYVKGKRKEAPFAFHSLDLGDIWVEGKRKRGESYWP